MDINQNINSQKQAIDLSNFTKNKNLPDKGTTTPTRTGSEISTDTPPLRAATVNLSQEGRAASLIVDFNSTADNISKINALRDSESFPKAHAAISYENVKNLLD